MMGIGSWTLDPKQSLVLQADDGEPVHVLVIPLMERLMKSIDMAPEEVRKQAALRLSVHGESNNGEMPSSASLEIIFPMTKEQHRIARENATILEEKQLRELEAFEREELVRLKAKYER